jgi:GNAT superfamily N-acetyltransferase
MNLQSLGYRTDLIFARFNGHVADRGDHLVIRTPSNETFYWGNFVIFDRAPKPEDADRWLETFHREVPNAKHIAIGWDAQEPGETHAFLEAGLSLESSIVMTAQAVHAPPKINADAEYRTLETDADYAQAVELGEACNDEHEPVAHRVFLERKFANYKRMKDAGLGSWFGAFVDGTLACSMGIFADGSGSQRIARFQSVETHPEFRRQGLCSTLVYTVARYGLETLKASTLVMVADPEYHAARIYESVGFNANEKQFGLQKSGD